MLHCYLGVNRVSPLRGGRGVLVTGGAARSTGRALAHRTVGGLRRSLAWRVVEADGRGQHVERDGLSTVPARACFGVGAGRCLGRGTAWTVADRAALGTLGANRTVVAVTAFSTLRAVVAVAALRAIITLRAVIAVAALRAVIALGTVVALIPICALRSIVALRAIIAIAVVALIVATGIELIVVAVIVVDIFAALPSLFIEARLAFPQHTEIMIRELKIIFGLHTVPRELGIARHALVFLKQLGGITALTIILTVARLSAGIGTPWLSPAAATASALTIVDQICESLTSRQCPHRRTVPFRLRLRANSAQ